MACRAGGGYGRAVTQTASSTLSTRIYLSLVGLVLAGAGSVFFWLMWRSYQRAQHLDHDWPVVPCVILESGTEERRIDPNSPPEFRYKLSFGFEWDGQAHRSTLVKLRGSGWSSSRDVAEAYIQRYPEGSQQECHVNPDQPEQAVLEKESKAPGYSLWFPGIFIVGGLGMVVGAWRPRRVKVADELPGGVG